jgi:ribosomal-protein-serine acetyltransferase
MQLDSRLKLNLGDDSQLRLLQIADAEELFSLVDSNRSHLRTWLPWLDDNNTSTDTEEYIKLTLQQLAKNLGFVMAICKVNSIAGLVGYNRIDWPNRIGYLGYWLSLDCQGKGLMTISCKALIDYGFEVLSLNRIVINCASENSRSRSIAKRLGFTHEGTCRDAEWLYDRFVNHEVYAILDRDWYRGNI